MTRWRSLPEGQRQGASRYSILGVPLMISYVPAGIRNFVVGVTVRIASDETTLRREKTHLNKLNLALVQVRYASFSSGILVHIIVRSDPQAGMATQLADIHHRARRVF